MSPIDTAKTICVRESHHTVDGYQYVELPKPIGANGQSLPSAVLRRCDRCDEMLSTFKYGSPRACEHSGGHRVDTEIFGLRCLDCGAWAEVLN